MRIRGGTGRRARKPNWQSQKLGSIVELYSPAKNYTSDILVICQLFPPFGARFPTWAPTTSLKSYNVGEYRGVAGDVNPVHIARSPLPARRQDPFVFMAGSASPASRRWSTWAWAAWPREPS